MLLQFAKDDDESTRFLNDPTVQSLLQNAKPLSTVRSDDYAAIFYVGGRGPVMDLPTDKANIRLANEVCPKSQWECLLPYAPPLVLPLWKDCCRRLPWYCVSGEVHLSFFRGH